MNMSLQHFMRVILNSLAISISLFIVSLILIIIGIILTVSIIFAFIGIPLLIIGVNRFKPVTKEISIKLHKTNFWRNKQCLTGTILKRSFSPC